MAYFYPPGTRWRTLKPPALRVLHALIDTSTEVVQWGEDQHTGDEPRPWGSTLAAAGEDFSARWLNARAQVDDPQGLSTALGHLLEAGVIAWDRTRRVRPNASGTRVVRLKQYRGSDFQPRPYPLPIPPRSSERWSELPSATPEAVRARTRADFGRFPQNWTR